MWDLFDNAIGWVGDLFGFGGADNNDALFGEGGFDLGGLSDDLGGLFTSIGGGLNDVFEGFSGGINSAFSGLGSVVSDIGSGIGDIFGDFSSGLGSALGGFSDFIGDAGSGITSAVGDILKNQSSAAAVAGLGSYLGQESANKANVELQRNANEFNQAEAERNRQFQSYQASRQMNFQELMSNTAYRRAVGDIKAAGLNPMLALMHGGASSPGGAAAGGSQAVGQAARVSNALGPAISSAFSAASASAQIDNMRAQNQNIEAQTKYTNALTSKAVEDTKLSTSSAYLQEEQMRELGWRMRKQEAEVENLVQEYKRIQSDTAKKEFERKELYPAQLRLMQLEASLSAYQLPGAKNTAEAASTWWGQNISPYVRDFSGIGTGARGLRR